MLGITKEQQLFKDKPKKISTFGKPKKPKVKKSDRIDEDYLNWLRTQKCVVTGRYGNKGIGVNNLHIHHIYSRNKGRNDYLAVPLMGYVHSWGGKAYHNNTKTDYVRKNDICTDDIIEWFEQKAYSFRVQYENEVDTDLNI